MKQAKNVPQLRFSGFDDDWEEKNFSEITYISATKNKSNLPLESYSITNENGFIPQDEQFENGGTMKDADKRMYWIVSPKSFGYNPARINVGSIGYYDGKKDVIVSSLYEIFKMTENCDDAFFWQWFKSDNLQKQVLKLQEGGVRLYFYYDKLCMGEIKIPSKSEQQKIGSLLSNLDSLIQAKTKKLESLKAVKKSLLQKCFPKAGAKVPEMRFAGFSGDWEKKDVKSFAIVKDGTHGTYPRVEKGIPLLSAKNVLDNELNISNDESCISEQSYKEITANGFPKIGDVLLSCVGSIGRCCILNTNEKVAFQRSVIFIRTEEIDKSFLVTAFQSEYVQNQISMLINASTIGGLYIGAVESLNIIFPSIAEQQKIGEFFSKYDSLISAQQKEIDKLKNIKKSLLQKMFI